MTENIEIAIQLLIVGMISVFIILGIVTGLARLLIELVNRYGPVTPGKKVWHEGRTASQKHIAVITAVVESVTSGKGSVHSIKKL